MRWRGPDGRLPEPVQLARMLMLSVDVAIVSFVAIAYSLSLPPHKS